MEHYEILYKYNWFLGFRTMVAVPFRYRYDSVPGIHKRPGSWFKAWYKTPKVMNEKRLWYNSEGYGRKRRSPRNLPDSWDDYPRADRYCDKSWKKNKIKKQWMKSL